MKLATLKDGSRDGLLAVVSRDLTRAHFAVGIASTVQQVLDDWNFRAPQLEDLYATLNGGKARHAFAFDPRHCMAPLPRAYRWAFAREAPTGDGSPSWTTAASDVLGGACDAVQLGSSDADMYADGGLAVITADIACGASDSEVLEAVRLFMLVQQCTVRSLPGEGQPAFEPLAMSCSPVAVTADELGSCWQGGRIELPTLRPGASGTWHVGPLLAALARRQRLGSGSIVSSFKHMGEELRTAARRLRLDAVDDTGQSIFGAIDPSLTGPTQPEAPSLLQPTERP